MIDKTLDEVIDILKLERERLGNVRIKDIETLYGNTKLYYYLPSNVLINLSDNLSVMLNTGLKYSSLPRRIKMYDRYIMDLTSLLNMAYNKDKHILKSRIHNAHYKLNTYKQRLKNAL